MRIYFSFFAAIAKMAKLKQERHNTVHVACQTDYFVVSFSCVEKSWATGAVKAVVLGFCVLFLQTLDVAEADPIAFASD